MPLMEPALAPCHRPFVSNRLVFRVPALSVLPGHVPRINCLCQNSVACIRRVFTLFSYRLATRRGREDEAGRRLENRRKSSKATNLPLKSQSILIVDPDPASRGALEDLVRSAGYEVAVSSSQAEGFKFVHDAGIDLLLLSADLADVQCCDALTEIKGNPATSATRVILLTTGGAAERARALDLGADEVLTSPWEGAELLARIRVQFREKHAFYELQEKTRIADEGREMAQTAFQALAVTEKMTRDAFSLGRALKIGVSALFAIAIVIAGIFLLYSRRADKEANRAYAVIAQLERGAHRQQQLMAETRSARADLQQSDVLDQKQQLKQQSDELRQKISGAEPGDVSSLRQQLEETTARLKRVETESQSAEEMIRAYAPSVCLLHASVSFVDRASGRPLRYGGINPDGDPLHDSDGNPVYTLEGRAPEVRADFFGTGFIVREGRILTNHHVAQPWWKNDELATVASQGLSPSIAELTAYFPEAKAGIPFCDSDISDQADLAVLKGDLSGLKKPVLKIDARKEAAVSGQPLLSLGYATGISAILARAGEDAVNDIAKATGGKPDEVLDELVRRKLIRPLVTQGHNGDGLPDKIVYDAQTTSGGSGRPLIHPDRALIGVPL